MLLPVVLMGCLLLSHCQPGGDGSEDLSLTKLISPRAVTDLVKVNADLSNLPEILHASLPAIGQIRGCTVFAIAPKIGLSAGHCFEQSKEVVGPIDCASFDQTIVWGKHGQKESGRSQCRQIYRMQTKISGVGGDFAIIQFHPEAPATVKMQDTPVVAGQRMTTVGYPVARGLTWSEECEVLSEGWLQWGSGYFPHLCATDSGNSGGPVFDLDTGEVIGLISGLSRSSSLEFATRLEASEVFRLLEAGIPPFIEAPGPVAPAEALVLKDRDITYLPHDADSLLMRFAPPSDQQQDYQSVSFTLEVDTQRKYDYLVITSPSLPAPLKLSGIRTRRYEDLQMPVEVRFISNRRRRSNFVKLRHAWMTP